MHLSLLLALCAGSVLAAPAEEPEPTPVEAADEAEDVGEAGEEPAPSEEEPSTDQAVLDKLAELEARLAAQEAQLAEQAKQIATTDAERAQEKIDADKAKDFRFGVTGYYRTRGHIFGAKWRKDAPVSGGLYEEQATSGKYLTQRIRLGLSASYKQLASVHIHAQGLDNVVWGDNADLASSPLFAETPSETRIDGAEAPAIQLFRAWTEFRVPIGLFKVGRQSSHWGMGLLANNGDGFDDDFGENHYGNQFDRILFGTNPVSIVQTIMGKKGPEIPITLAIAVDRLVEDPLTQFYGYKCDPGINRDTDPERYDDRCDVDGDGLTDLEHDYDEGRLANERPSDWWVDQRDDVWEMVYALIYRGKNIRYFGGVGDLTAGAYLIHRTQKETESNVVVGDIYLDGRVHGVQLQFEGVGIWGRTRALALPDRNAEDPLRKRASLYSYVARLSYEQPYWKILMESGFASGDEQVNDELFTGRSMHPDHNVGLLLYEEVLARVTARLWGDSARGLRSNGGVYNSHYINPKVYAYPVPNTQVIGGFLMAWPDKPDGAIIRCNQADVDNLGCAAASVDSKALGWELDFAIKHRWHKHLLLSVETGYSHVTDRVALAAAGLQANAKDGGGNFWTLQSRIAWEF